LINIIEKPVKINNHKAMDGTGYRAGGLLKYVQIEPVPKLG
jgi:hypothetical protein